MMPPIFRRKAGSSIVAPAIALLGLVVVSAGGIDTRPGTQAAPVTFTKDISPILFSHCTNCHRPDGNAQISLLTYDAVKRHATQIRTVTKSRYMPPWKPEAGYGTFVGERRLTDQQVQLIERWISDGLVEGDPSDLPPQPRWAPGWQLGEPDLVVTLPEYTLRSDGTDLFRNFVVPIPGAGTRYVSAVEFRPGNRAVHHADILVDSTPASRRLDEADPEPGYEGVISFSAHYPDGHSLGWTPGKVAALSPKGLAWRLEAGTDFVVQLHMQPTGKSEHVQPAIGLFFTKDAPTRTPSIVRLGRRNLDIAPGLADYRTNDSYVLPVDVEVQSIQPHAHYRARELRAWATLPDGTRRWLIVIRNWDFNWQDLYQYSEPFHLPAGTRLEMEYVFDNSAANPRNPDHPPKRVLWGFRTTDEMSDLFVQVMTRTELERERLDANFRGKGLAEDVVGLETEIKVNPDLSTLHNDAALIYLELGQADRAVGHFEAVSQLNPKSAVARYNLGVALKDAGRSAEAAQRYREALAIDPTYAAAHSALGSTLLTAGDTGKAIEQLQWALRLNPNDPETHLTLARSLVTTGKIQEGISHYQDGLRNRPDCVPCLEGLAWLLSVHWDPSVRQPADAVRLAGQAVELTHNSDAVALQVLAAAYGAAGRFDQAVHSAETAATLAAAGRMADLSEQLRQQLVLYRQNRPYVVPRE
jgi:tetratricopeptide (TPR) repeat protein